jgi:prepilin-type N-terminal cleavage/methylation domain-containing protein
MASELTQKRRGLTLVELLVVMTIIGILIALILPAVQAAREAARSTQCKNNLRQIGLAAQSHLQAYKFSPTGGWGYHWVGDPDRGFGQTQPGGWAYNILPFIDEKAIRAIGKGSSGAAKQEALKALIATPAPFFSCPSRRGGIVGQNEVDIYNVPGMAGSRKPRRALTMRATPGPIAIRTVARQLVPTQIRRSFRARISARSTGGRKTPARSTWAAWSSQRSFPTDFQKHI